MAKPPRPLAGGSAIAKNVTQKNGLTGVPKRARSPKGKLIPRALGYSRKFRERLEHHVNSWNVDFTKLGIGSVKDLRNCMIEARNRLGAKNVTAITATAWLGETFQVIVEKHRVIKDLQEWAALNYVEKMNGYLKSKNSRAVTMNSHFDRVGVKKPFKNIEKIYDVRLKQPGQTTGKEFFDNGRLASNADNQKLPMEMEIKTRGAGGELPGQIADIDQRLKESPPGTKMTYSIEGQPGKYEIDLRDLIQIRDKQNLKLPLDADAFSRIGVIAGTRALVKVARDASGRPYIRVKLPASTDFVRRVLEKMLRDKSWQ